MILILARNAGQAHAIAARFKLKRDQWTELFDRHDLHGLEFPVVIRADDWHSDRSASEVAAIERALLDRRAEVWTRR